MRKAKNQINLFNLKSIKKQKPTLNDYDRFQKKIKPLYRRLGAKKILKILYSYQNGQHPKHHKRHRKPRINLNRRRYALDELINHKKGNYTLNATEIARKHHISRTTLYSWFNKWKSNPHRASHTMLFTNHQTKAK